MIFIRLYGLVDAHGTDAKFNGLLDCSPPRSLALNALSPVIYSSSNLEHEYVILWAIGIWFIKGYTFKQ